MGQTNQNMIGVLQQNTYGRRFSSQFPAGNRPALNYPALYKNDFSSGTPGQAFPGFHSTTVYQNDQPWLTGNCMKVNISAVNPPALGGSMNYGGRINLPQPVTYGSSIWFSMKLFHPQDQTWGYCYDPSDAVEAAANGKEVDGNEWLKFMVLAPTNGTARIYLQPKSVRRNATQFPGHRLYSEASQQPLDNPAAAFPLGRWYTLQMNCHLADNGYMRYWIDDQFMGQANAVPVTQGNSIAQWGIGDYWNGCPYTDGSASTHFWVKDVIICTDMAGFGAPTDLDSGGRPFISPNRIPRDFQ